jgi:uncharacterized protein YjiS (DUF1127 family)
MATIGSSFWRVLGTSWPRIDPLGYLRGLDANYRERRRIEELSPETLRDVGLTADDIARSLRR